MPDLEPESGIQDGTQNSALGLGNQVGRIRLLLMGDN